MRPLGGDESEAATARSIPAKLRIVGGIFIAEMLALATTCRYSYTMSSKREISQRHFESSIVLMS